MGKASRNKKQPLREIKLTQGEISSALRDKVAELYPKDSQNQEWLDDMISTAMENIYGAEQKYAATNNILMGVMEWAERKMRWDSLDIYALSVAVTKARPHPKEEDPEEPLFAMLVYTWDEKEQRWNMVNHTALHPHEVFHEALTTRFKNVPDDVEITPASLVLTYCARGDDQPIEGGREIPLRALKAYGWELKPMEMIPAEVESVIEGASVTPGDDIMAYYLTESLPPMMSTKRELMDIDRVEASLTRQITAGARDNKQHRFTTVAVDERGDKPEVFSMTLRRKGVRVEAIKGEEDYDPIYVMASTYAGAIWESALGTLNILKENGRVGMMSWLVSRGQITPLTAQETKIAYEEDHGTGRHLGPNPKADYLDAFPLEVERN